MLRNFSRQHRYVFISNYQSICIEIEDAKCNLAGKECNILVWCLESFPLAQSYMAINQLIARWVIIRTRLSHFDWEELIINFGIVNIIPRTFHLMGNLIIANQVDLEEESNNCYLRIILINNPNNYLVGPKYSMANKNIIPKDTLGAFSYFEYKYCLIKRR